MCLISRLSANATGAQQGEQIVGTVAYSQPYAMSSQTLLAWGCGY